MSPLRLYLLAAIPFFLVFFTASRVEERADPLEFVTGSLVFTASPPPALLPPLPPLPAESAGDAVARAEWQQEFVRRRAHNDSIARITNEGVAVGVQRVFDILPAAVGIVMVPLLAMFLTARVASRPRFIARLVFALHLHTVGFVLALLASPLGLGLPVGLGGSSLYLVLARRELLRESWGRASLLGAAVALAYAALFLIAYISFVLLLLTVAPGWFSGGT